MRSAAGSRPRPLRAADALRSAGLDRLDADVLLAHTLGVSRADLYADSARSMTEEELLRFRSLVARRSAGEPVAYLVGRRDFRWISLSVDPRVLIPRPETEHLVEAALGLPSGARVVDVGTGSGAVALALASERPDLEVVAVDVSAAALDVAQANASALGLAVTFAGGDLLDEVVGPVDAVVSNPPYVRDSEELPVDVASFEPSLALRAGADGLDVFRRLVPAAAARSPFLALEVGAGQAGAVAELCREAGYAEIEVVPDLAGIERVVVARR